MTTSNQLQRQETESNLVQLSCKECCQTIPYSPESEDYVAYFWLPEMGTEISFN